jgi:hypothetical protein
MKRILFLQALIFILIPMVAFAAGPQASWTYAAYDDGIDIIAIGQNSSPPEIYVSGGNRQYWLALRYNAVSKEYDQIYFSGFYSSYILAIKVADATGDSVDDIVILTENGRIQIHDQASKALISTITTPSGYSSDMEIVDLDGDGSNEIIICQSGHLYVYAASGTLEWELDSAGGYRMVVAQMDADSSLEIATTDGYVIDADTRTIQWDWTYNFGSYLTAADFDGDGYDELIVSDSSYVWAYDVDRRLPKWSVSISSYPGVLLPADIDADGLVEIMVGPQYSSSIVLLDPVTLQQEPFISDQSSYINCMVINDVDGDGDSELIWGNSYRLDIAGVQSRLIEWVSPDTYSPFVGPEVGDLDGDGRNEMAVVFKNSSYSNGCGIMVFDAVTRELRASSGSIIGGSYCSGINDFKLRDVDLDGRLELLTASSYNGRIDIIGFNSDNSFTSKWINASSYTFYSIDAADIDNDQVMEILGGASDGYVYVFDYASSPGPLEWKSLYLRASIRDLEAVDINQDGIKEIISMGSSGDVYIFNGVTKALDAMIMGPFTAMKVQNADGILSILLGNSSGELMVYRYSSGTYIQTYKRKLTNYGIDAFTVDWRDHVWVSTSSGSYSSTSTLYEMTLDGAVLDTYSGYGQYFGKRVAISQCSQYFFTGGNSLVAAFPVNGATSCSPDFDGDGKFDVAVWRPENGVWYQLRSGAPGTYTDTQWGLPTDKAIPADYDGDGRIDLAVWRPENGIWYIRSSIASGSLLSTQWGAPTHQPIPADYDGDGKTDLAVWDKSNGHWYILSSKLPGTYSAIQWGLSTDIPVPGDYDGDGSADIAVWRSGDGGWYILPSNSPGTYISIQWGLATDIPAPGDYDGDGRTDIAVLRLDDGVWYILPSGSTGTYTSTLWGLPGDIPVPGDYDGDGKLDIAVWRQGSGVWYILPSGSPGSYTSIHWGLNTDMPISSLTTILESMP